MCHTVTCERHERRPADLDNARRNLFGFGLIRTKQVLRSFQFLHQRASLSLLRKTVSGNCKNCKRRLGASGVDIMQEYSEAAVQGFYEFEEQRILLHLRLPDSDHALIEAEVVSSREIAGGWEYAVTFRRRVGSAAMAAG
jgi:hypothetical protein